MPINRLASTCSENRAYERPTEIQDQPAMIDARRLRPAPASIAKRTLWTKSFQPLTSTHRRSRTINMRLQMIYLRLRFPRSVTGSPVTQRRPMTVLSANGWARSHTANGPNCGPDRRVLPWSVHTGLALGREDPWLVLTLQEGQGPHDVGPRISAVFRHRRDGQSGT